MNRQAKVGGQIERYFSTTKRGKIYERAVGDIEKGLIEEALRYSFGNQVAAAKILGINRNTIHAKIKRLNIDLEQFKR